MLVQWHEGQLSVYNIRPAIHKGSWRHGITWSNLHKTNADHKPKLYVVTSLVAAVCTVNSSVDLSNAVFTTTTRPQFYSHSTGVRLSVSLSAQRRYCVSKRMDIRYTRMMSVQGVQKCDGMWHAVTFLNTLYGHHSGILSSTAPLQNSKKEAHSAERKYTGWGRYCKCRFYIVHFY